MVIKKLQQDYTTPEQSKRLLELGVPVDSANMFYALYSDGDCASIPGVLVDGISEIEYVLNNNLPCWSAGRLMEIIDICCKLHIYEDWIKTRLADEIVGIPVEYLVSTMEYLSSDNSIDFSKLEE